MERAAGHLGRPEAAAEIADVCAQLAAHAPTDRGAACSGRGPET